MVGQLDRLAYRDHMIRFSLPLPYQDLTLFLLSRALVEEGHHATISSLLSLRSRENGTSLCKLQGELFHPTSIFGISFHARGRSKRRRRWNIRVKHRKWPSSILLSLQDTIKGRAWKKALPLLFWQKDTRRQEKEMVSDWLILHWSEKAAPLLSHFHPRPLGRSFPSRTAILPLFLLRQAFTSTSTLSNHLFVLHFRLRLLWYFVRGMLFFSIHPYRRLLSLSFDVGSKENIFLFPNLILSLLSLFPLDSQLCGWDTDCLFFMNLFPPFISFHRHMGSFCYLAGS